MLKNGVEMAGFIWEEANRTGPQESAVEEKPNSLRQRWFRSSLSEALVVAGPVHGGTQPWHPGQTWGLPWSGSEQVDEKRQPTCKIFKFGNGNSSFPLKKKILTQPKTNPEHHVCQSSSRSLWERPLTRWAEKRWRNAGSSQHTFLRGVLVHLVPQWWQRARFRHQDGTNFKPEPQRRALQARAPQGSRLFWWALVAFSARQGQHYIGKSLKCFSLTWGPNFVRDNLIFNVSRNYINKGDEIQTYLQHLIQGMIHPDPINCFSDCETFLTSRHTKSGENETHTKET